MANFTLLVLKSNENSFLLKPTKIYEKNKDRYAKDYKLANAEKIEQYFSKNPKVLGELKKSDINVEEKPKVEKSKKKETKEKEEKPKEESK